MCCVCREGDAVHFRRASSHRQEGNLKADTDLPQRVVSHGGRRGGLESYSDPPETPLIRAEHGVRSLAPKSINYPHSPLSFLLSVETVHLTVSGETACVLCPKPCSLPSPSSTWPPTLKAPLPADPATLLSHPTGEQPAPANGR